MAGCRQEHVLEVPEHMRADGIALKAGEQNAILPFAVKHIKVIHPEVGQDFLELPIRVNGAVQLVLDQIGIHQFLRLPYGHCLAAQIRQVRKCFRRKHAKDLAPLFGIQRIEQSHSFFTASSLRCAYLLGGEQIGQRRHQPPKLLLARLLLGLARFSRFLHPVFGQAFQYLWRDVGEDHTAIFRAQRSQQCPAIFDRTVHQSAELLRSKY